MNRGIAGLATIAFYTLIPATAAHAYIGPGTGAGVVAVVLGLLGSIFLLFLGILWYPFKRLIKTLKKKEPKLERDINHDHQLDSDHNGLCRCDRTGPEVTVQTNTDQIQTGRR
jgi:hypothetical protein